MRHTVIVRLAIVGVSLVWGSNVHAQDAQAGARARADSAIQLSQSLDDGVQAAGASGVLIAEGDSWFAYPGTNLVKELRRRGFRVASTAENGARVEEMAYSVDRLADLHAAMRSARQEWQATPRALLLSGGGNDMVGETLRLLLNHAAGGTPDFDMQMLNALIDVRLATAIRAWITSARMLSRQVYGSDVNIPVVMHGYDYAIPDGRGYEKIGITLKGPWMRPSLVERGYTVLAANTALVRQLIDRYNAMLARLAAEPQLNFRYVKLAGQLSTDLVNNNYRVDWDNELHPEKPAFRRLAAELERAIP
jgi:hypothetical protein